MISEESEDENVEIESVNQQEEAKIEYVEKEIQHLQSQITSHTKKKPTKIRIDSSSDEENKEVKKVKN